MTLVGCHHLEPGVREVDSVGAGEFDGWVTVAELPAAKFPTQTAHNVGFVVWGSFGGIAGTAFGSQATIEVGVAQSQFTPFPDAICRYSLIDANMQVSPARSMPFFFVRSYAPAIAGRGTWNPSAVTIQVRARIALNGDAPSSVAASFRVSNIAILAFDLTAIGSANYVAHLYRPANPVNNNLQSEGPQEFSSTPSIPSGDWLVFSATRYEPYDHTGAPAYQTAYLPDGTWGSAEALFGEGGFAQNNARARMGALPRGHASRVRWSHGGFRSVASAPANWAIGIRGIDWHLNGGLRSRFYSWEALAIKLSKLGAVNVLRKDAGALAQIYNDIATPSPPYEPAEWGRGFASDYLVIANAAVHLSAPVAYGLNIGYEGNSIGHGNSPTGQWPLTAAYTHGQQERVHNHVALDYKSLKAGAVQFRFRALLDAAQQPTGIARDGRDFCAAAWDWENDPNYQAYAAPVTPPDLVIVPPREAPDVGALNALPIEPNDVRSETVDTPRNEFIADAGYVIRWPRFVGVRCSHSLTWGPLRREDRDALLDFFAAQQHRAFKWTPPRAAAPLPYVLVSGPSSQDVGVLHTVQAEVLELVFVGP